jgi:hypothetical protein
VLDPEFGEGVTQLSELRWAREIDELAELREMLNGLKSTVDALERQQRTGPPALRLVAHSEVDTAT